MKITLIAVGTKMPAWVTTGFEEYQRRFPKDMPFELIEIPAGKRGKNADIKRILEPVSYTHLTLPTSDLV